MFRFALTLIAVTFFAVLAFGQQPDFSSFERRLTDLESRMTAVESKFSTFQVPRSPAAPASLTPQVVQQRYGMDATGIYWPVQAEPGPTPGHWYGAATPQVFYGGFAESGGCANGSCGSGGNNYGPVRGFFRSGGFFRR